MKYVCIDTNLFLGLYWTDEDFREIFTDIRALKDRLVFPDIILDEFLRNRSKILDRIADDLQKRIIEEFGIPAILQAEDQNATALRDTGENYNQLVWGLYDDIQRMVVDPKTDPMAQVFDDLVHDPAVRVFRRTEDLITRAHRRKLLGNPPKSPGVDTIGDEVIWETLLANLSEDLVFITRDRTYRHHATYLKEEYLERTGGDLEITDRVSDALKIIGKPPSPALVKFEGRDTQDVG